MINKKKFLTEFFSLMDNEECNAEAESIARKMTSIVNALRKELLDQII